MLIDLLLFELLYDLILYWYHLLLEQLVHAYVVAWNELLSWLLLLFALRRFRLMSFFLLVVSHGFVNAFFQRLLDLLHHLLHG